MSFVFTKFFILMSALYMFVTGEETHVCKLRVHEWCD